MAITVKLENLAIARGRNRLAEGLTLTLEPGSVTVLAGPNGAGKSTLLETIAGDLAPDAGTLCYEGHPLADISLGRRAELRTMLRQQSDIAFDFPVADVVAMGLTPHRIGEETAGGLALVSRALADLDLNAMAARPATRLSGGEIQRVHLARSLVQLRAGMARGSGGLLLLDEPTGGLDYRHQLALLRLLRDEARSGATVIASLHDLSFACRLADRLLLLGAGRLLADVPPARLDHALVAELYRIDRDEAALLLGARSSALPMPLAAE